MDCLRRDHRFVAALLLRSSAAETASQSIYNESVYGTWIKMQTKNGDDETYDRAAIVG